jgi:hypothetical protein
MGLARKRHHRKRMLAKRRRQFKRWRWIDEKGLRKMIDTPASYLCSCEGCKFRYTRKGRRAKEYRDDY